MKMNDRFVSLEKERRIYILLYFSGLLLELAGLWGLLRGQRPAGISVALFGLFVWCSGAVWGKKRYLLHCSRIIASDGLHIMGAAFPDRKNADAMFPMDAFIPPVMKAGKPLHMYPVCGYMDSIPVFVSECTLPFYLPDSPKNIRHLVGTLIAADSPACSDITVFCGQPLGGNAHREDFSSWHPVPFQDHKFHIFCRNSSDNISIEGNPAAVLEELCSITEHGAIVACTSEKTALFLPLRFYSGHFALNDPLKPESLDSYSFPEFELFSKLISFIQVN